MQAPDLRHIKIEQLIFSPTAAQKERRARFNKVALADLTTNVKAVGIAQPILVRQFNSKDANTGKDRFEIVFGERRVLAAQGAGLEHIPAVVRNLSDEQALELQLVENLQREDTHPMAEAEGYEELRKLGRQIEDITTKVGKSRSYVYGRMKLLDLCKPAREAFYDGKINASIALLIASLDANKHQEKALAHILKPHEWNDQPLSFREAAQYVRTTFMLDLAKAPFPIKDANLVAAAGACTTCPKRSGNSPGLFPDADKDDDTCTDGTCFQLKRQTYVQLQKDQASKAVLPLITGNEAKKILSRYTSSLQNGFVRASDKIDNDKKGRTYSQVLKQISDGVAMLQDPEKGTFAKVYDLKHDGIAAALKAAGVQTSKPRQNPVAASRPRKETDKEAAEREDEKKRTALYVCRLVRAVFEKTPRKLGATEWSRILDILFQAGNFEAKALVQLGLCETEEVAAKVLYSPDTCGKLLKLVDEADLPRLAFAVVLSEAADYLSGVRELESHAKRLGVDSKALRKAIDTEADAAMTAAVTAPYKTSPAKGSVKPKVKGKAVAKKKKKARARK